MWHDEAVNELSMGAQDFSDNELDEKNILTYLRNRGLTPAAGSDVRSLGGGVSNVVLAIGEGPGSMVVKQALPRLRVADEWLAPRERALAEADALDLVNRVTPGNAPQVLDRDPERCALVVERAPSEWEDWKSLLLAGTIDPNVGARLGSVLARWHNATVQVSTLSPRFSARAPFEALRVDPYYRTVARRLPHTARSVLHYVDEMDARRLCLVHGDFSPKNVLVGPDPALWVIDFEVAHLGDPAFDVAFLLCHLMLKSLHRPELAAEYDRCAVDFASQYQAGARAELAPSWEYVLGHVGCLLLARVAGKSPAEYLTTEGRARAQRFGEILVSGPPGTPGDLAGVRQLACK
jgi:aminoglycoside phosphotransferase (APT) family kinase protein